MDWGIYIALLVDWMMDGLGYLYSIFGWLDDGWTGVNKAGSANRSILHPVRPTSQAPHGIPERNLECE